MNDAADIELGAESNFRVRSSGECIRPDFLETSVTANGSACGNDTEDETEDILCCIEFPELAKTNYIMSSFGDNGQIILQIKVSQRPSGNICFRTSYQYQLSY